MPTGPALRTAVISLVAIMVGTLLAAGICVFEIVRAPVDTALAWGIGLGFAISGSVLMAGCRLLRLLRARRAGRAVAEPRRVVPLLGVCKKIYAPYLVLVPLTGHLPDPEDVRYAPGVVELQRFLWDPAINRLSPGDEVLLHRSGRCVVVDLLDGARLWPSGSLRTSEPNGWTLTERPSGVRSRYRELRERARRGDKAATAAMRKLIRRETGMAPDEVIDPVSPRFDVPPEPVTTRPEPGYALALMGVTGIGALGLYGLVPAIAAVVYAAGLAVHVWGWYGGDPERPSEIWAPG